LALFVSINIANVSSQQPSHPLFPTYRQQPKQQQQQSGSASTAQQQQSQNLQSQNQPQLQSQYLQPQQQPQFVYAQQPGQQQQPQFILSQQPPQQQPQFQFVPQQQPPQQQFFDPNQQFVNQQPPQQFSPQQFFPQPQPQPQKQHAPQGPQISWGKCSQLEPSEKEKMTKATVITKCLETTPLPANITRLTVELHREQIAACALQNEGWFTKQGGYDFNKAENEIKNKKLDKKIEESVLGYHNQCKKEAEDKFPSVKKHVIAQIQLYQACMDYFISDVCGIEVNEPESSGPQFTSFQ